jgi:hypothetical protein
MRNAAIDDQVIVNDERDDAQKIAQKFLALMPVSDKQDMSDKLGVLGEKYTGALRVHKKYFPHLSGSSATQEGL